LLTENAYSRLPNLPPLHPMPEKKKTTKPEKKEPAKKTVPVSDIKEEKADNKKAEYLYAVGKRKTAVAQVRLYKKGTGKGEINEKDYKKYFPTPDLQARMLAALNVVGQNDKLDVTVKVKGGGTIAQAEAVRHGIAKALIQLNQNFRKPLKKAGYLTRDPRKKERKKPGLKGARRAPQWKKR